MGFIKGARLRRGSLILLATCVSSLAAAGAAQAATLTVNSTEDGDTGSCTATSCTLRDAINYSSSGDTIVLPAGTYTLSPTLGQLDVNNSRSLTINGAGASKVTVSGDNSTRVFYVEFRSSLTISGMTITGGSGGGDGGGIESAGALTINDSTLSGNTSSSYGGGIGVVDGGTLTIAGSTISDNTVQADESGAGISCFCIGMSINDSTISGNHDLSGSGSDDGGGIYVSLFSGLGARPLTAAPRALPLGTGQITNTTISGNSVNGGGSGLGGGIYLDFGTLSVANTTIAGNSAAAQGGGIWANSIAALNSTNNTVANNSSPDGANLYAYDNTLGGFQNTLVAEPKGGGQNCSSDATNFPPSQGHNLEDDAAKSCGFSAVGDISGASAVLGGLANNGGPTETMALLAGSPAIDHGATISSITTDQRGGPRPQPAGGAYDIGAYERGAVGDMGVTKTAKPNPVRVGSHLTYTLTATNNGPSPDPAFDVTVVDKLPSSVKFVSDKPSQGKCGFSSGTLTCHLGTIDKGKSATVKLVVTPKKKGTVINTGTVSSSAKDYNSGNDRASVRVRVKAAPKPVAVTGRATQITSSSARLHGKVKPNGASTTYYFQYGTSTKYGSRTGSAGAGKGKTFRGVVSGVRGLKAGTLYHYRVVAHNANGTARGSDRTFRTPSVKPAFTG